MDGLSAELSARGKDIPPHVHKVLAALPPGTHPMTQFSTAVLALQVRCPSLRIGAHARYLLECLTTTVDASNAVPP